MKMSMNNLKDSIRSFLWIDYGQFEGFIPDEDITLNQLYHLRSILETTIREQELKEHMERIKQ